MTVSDIKCNTKKAIKFLKSFHGNRLLNIISIDPITKDINGITRPVSDQDLFNFIERYNGRRNLYFSVNTPIKTAPDSKLRKEHIGEINAVWLDIDPDKNKNFEDERVRIKCLADRLKTNDNPPTYILDSGGGVQAFWLFETPLSSDDKDHAESLSRGLSEQYGGDKVHNIDRIMRIPFTMNMPTAQKKGRKPTLATVIYAPSLHGKRYTDMSFITPVGDGGYNDGKIIPYDTSKLKHKLPQVLRDKLVKTPNRKIKELYNGTIEKPSRSEYDFTLTKELKWGGYSLDEIAQILWCYPHGKNTELTGREIARCYARVENPFEGLPDDYIAEIEKQVNPLTMPHDNAKQGESNLTLSGDEVPKRLKAIVGGTDTGRTSGIPLLKGLIDQNTITVIYGKSNVGKSFVATDIAAHIAAGKDWGSHKLKKKMGVLYVCAEAGLSYGRRLVATKRRLDIKEGTPLNEWPFEYIAMGVNFLSEKDDLKDVAILARRQKRGTGVPIGVIVIDTLATTFSGGNENSSEDMGQFITNMKWLQEVTGATIIIVHHSGKDQAAGARGHSSLSAATDTELEVVSEKRGEKYYRQIKTKKQRDGESDTLIKFGLCVTELWNDEDGDMVTTCHVVLEDDPLFGDVTPSIEDELTSSELLAIKAIEYYDEHIGSNPDITIPKKFTEKELKALILNEFKRPERDRIFAKSVGVSCVPLRDFKRPVERGILKFLEHQRRTMEQKDIHIINDKYQIVTQ